jgi:hypothetical protein
VAGAVGLGRLPSEHGAALRRMGLERPRGAAEWLQQRLVSMALKATSG